MFGRHCTGTASKAMLQRSSRFAERVTRQHRARWMSTEKEAAAQASKVEAPVPPVQAEAKTGWWSDAKFWGGLGALAGWGMSGSAIYDAAQQGPEVISMTMTPVLIVYSTLFARWAYVVTPPNPLLMYCHIANVAAQLNQLRRALEFKMNNGEEDQVKDLMNKVAVGGVVTAAAVAAGPTLQAAITGAGLGIVSEIAAAQAGPFTVHFWAPMSKWFISGASFLDLHRPTDKISLAQYTALTLTGFFFSRYALLVKPINYTLCSVNIALFGSSAWHLGRKIKADYIDDNTKDQ